MKNKLVMLSLGLGLFLTGCQIEGPAEDIQMNNATSEIQKESNFTNKIHTPEWMAAIHNPEWMIAIHTPEWMAAIHTPEWMMEIHNPEWMVAEIAVCEDLPEYDGDKNLVVNSKSHEEVYGGIIEVDKLNAGGELAVCGTLKINKSANIHHAGEVTMVGMMMVGSQEEPKDLTINHGGHLNMHGILIVTGDLILNSGATLEFNQDIEHNNLIVEGEIIRAEDAIVRGEFVDHSDHQHED
jgi:hypothetical protein